MGARDCNLVEVLECATPIRVRDTLSTAARNTQHTIAFTIFDRDPGEHVGDAGAIAGDANAQLAGQSCVGAGHVRRTRLVSGRHELDAVLRKARIQAHVGPVDDAENLCDAFFGEHRCHHLATDYLLHFCRLPVGF